MRITFESFEDQYAIIRQSACGRSANSVIIFVALEVDGLAAVRMLCQMLRGDNIAFHVIPVSNFDDVVEATKANLTADIKTVFMVNCGAIYDIPKHFDLEHGGDLRVYVLDNHRPVHLKNIYSRHNVVVFDDDLLANDRDDYDADFAQQQADDIPSEASEMASDVGDEDSGLDSEEEGDEDEEDLDDDENEPAEGDEEEDEEAEFGEDEEEEQEGDGEEEQEEEQEGEGTATAGDADDEKGDDEEDEHDITKQDVFDPEEAQPLEAGGDPAAVEELDQTRDLDEGAPRTTSMESDDDDAHDDEDDESRGQKRRQQREGDDDEEEEGEEQEGDEEEGEEEVHDENEEDDEDVRVVGKKRRRMNDKGRDKRQRIHQYYCRAPHYSSPTALLLLPVVKARFGANGHVPLDVTWQAILGMTDQYLKGRLSDGQYEECCHYLQVQLGDHLVSGGDRMTFQVPMSLDPATSDPINNNSTTGANNNSTSTNSSIQIGGAQTGHITETAEYRFFLHRHWSIFDAMYHSTYIATKFPIWQARGTTKLQELLAEMGVPLLQCKQAYQFMAPECRQHFRLQLQDTMLTEKYKLQTPGVTYKSFCRYTGFKSPLAAEDVVQAATALLELYSRHHHSHSNNSNNNSSGQHYLSGGVPAEDPASGDLVTTSVVVPQHPGGARSTTSTSSSSSSADSGSFFEAYALLGARQDALVKKGIHLALDVQRAIVKKASAMLDGQDSIHRFNRIYYAYLRSHTHANTSTSSNTTSSSTTSSSNTNSSNTSSAVREAELIFGRPMVLAKLGQYIMEVKRNQSKKEGGWQGSSLLPLVLLSERVDGSFLVLGVSPLGGAMGETATAQLSEEHLRRLRPLSNFRQFFKLAAKDMNIKFRSNSFDPNVVEIAREDTQDFLGALDNVLKKATPHFFARA